MKICRDFPEKLHKLYFDEMMTRRRGSATIQSMSARDAFGVAVRTIGLLMIIFGAYCQVTIIAENFFGRPSFDTTFRFYFLPGWLFLLVGFWFLVYADPVVNLSYGKPVPPGKCPQCGYDIRASEDKCPECGTEIEKPV